MIPHFFVLHKNENPQSKNQGFQTETGVTGSCLTVTSSNPGFHMDKTKTMDTGHYVRLLTMGILSFISMYVLMYAMVNSFSNVFHNFNQFYMAGLMTAPMIVIELSLMRAMFPDKTLNAIIVAVSLVALVAFWIGIRQQTAIADEQFLKSMIPHHAGAILMCEKASLRDTEIKELCKTIIASQRSEIDQMKAKLQLLKSTN